VVGTRTPPATGAGDAARAVTTTATRELELPNRVREDDLNGPLSSPHPFG
jgi:hypothetical protein